MKYNSNLYVGHPKRAVERFLFSLLITCVLASIVCACDDFVEVDLPQNQLIADGVFEESATATAAMTAIYSKMRDAGVLSGSATGVSNLIGCYADELDFYGSGQSYVQPFFKNAVLPSDRAIQNLWNDSYNQVYSANAVLEGVTKSNALPEADRAQLKGEALFVRALLHFYLTNLYGAVPYVTTTDYEVNKKVGRTSVAKVYEQAALDLQEAISLLSPNYVAQGRTRPNQFTAYALLARLQLYAGLWNEAAVAASTVLNETGLYPYETDLNAIFLNNSSNTIWQLDSGLAGANTIEGTTFIFENGPPPQNALTASLLSAFEPADLRKDLWTRTISGNQGSWSHAFKYKERLDTGNTVELSIIFRTGELYLIRAEARARLGELTTAKEDLNVIRNRAGLNTTTAATQQDILTAVLKERRVELFTEMGHRFFDLKRYGQLDAVLSVSKPGWNTTELVLPLPQLELDLNPALLPQNQGY